MGGLWKQLAGNAPWSLTRKLVFVFVAAGAVGATTAALALQNLRSLSSRVDRLEALSTTGADSMARLSAALDQERTALLALVATRDAAFLDVLSRAQAESREALDVLRRAYGLGAVEDLAALHESRAAEAALADEVAAAANKADLATVAPLTRAYVARREAVARRLDRLRAHQGRDLAEARARVSASLSGVIAWTLAGALVCAGWAAAVAALLRRTVRTIRHSQADLHQYVDRVETKASELESFAGRIAHDLRNVLSPVSMLPALLRVRARQPADANGSLEDAAEIVERAGAAATRVLDGLLAFACAGASVGDELTPSLTVVVEEVSRELEPLRSRVGATVEHDIVDSAIRCPPGLLHVVVMNLLSNAYKFLEGCPRREVRVTAREVDDAWSEILVEDSGCGIPVEHRVRIFEPFYRAPGARAAGHGIGLATVRRIVEACGGTISVDSAPRSGARFRVRLPLATATATARRPAASRPPAPEL